MRAAHLRNDRPPAVHHRRPDRSGGAHARRDGGACRLRGRSPRRRQRLRGAGAAAPQDASACRRRDRSAAALRHAGQRRVVHRCARPPPGARGVDRRRRRQRRRLERCLARSGRAGAPAGDARGCAADGTATAVGAEAVEAALAAGATTIRRSSASMRCAAGASATTPTPAWSRWRLPAIATCTSRCWRSISWAAAASSPTRSPRSIAPSPIWRMQGSARGWHRAAHALVALAAASPERGAAALKQFTGSRIWQLRLYAARAAAQLGDRARLDAFGRDDDDNVREAAIEGCGSWPGTTRTRSTSPGSRAAAIRSCERPRRRSKARRTASRRRRRCAPPGSGWSPRRATTRTMRGTAITKTLTSLGVDAGPSPKIALQSDLDDDELRRLASPRARITIRDVGIFDLALFTSEAPATVLRFAQLAEPGTTTG